jgi:hypothetical protein
MKDGAHGWNDRQEIDCLLHITPDMHMVVATAIMSPGGKPLLAKRDLDQFGRFLSSPRVWQQPLVQSFSRSSKIGTSTILANKLLPRI